MTNPDISLDADERLALVKWYVDQNRLDKALAEIKTLLDDDADDELLLTGARLYAQLRLFRRAEVLFTQYLERNPDSSNARFQLGMTRFDNGEIAAALDTWQQVLRAEPHNPPALFYTALARLQKGEAGESSQLLHSILEHTREDNLYHGKARDLLGQLEQQAGGEAADSATMAGKNPYSTEH